MDGVTLRDQFAAAAMQGIIAYNGADGRGGVAAVARSAYEFADAMLAARKIPCRLCGKPLADGEVWRKTHRECADAENAAADRPELRLVDLGGEG